VHGGVPEEKNRIYARREVIGKLFARRYGAENLFAHGGVTPDKKEGTIPAGWDGEGGDEMGKTPAGN